MTDSHTEPSSLGIYLYCLARPECLPAVKGPAEQDLRGVDERYPVGALEEAGVVAVIGDVDSGEFCDQNMQKLPWVAPRAFRHEEVVERIMGASPVLPVKFGTIFRSRTSLKEFGSASCECWTICTTRPSGASRATLSKTKPGRWCLRQIPRFSRGLRRCHPRPGRGTCSRSNWMR